jgi:hypothetical protein
MTNKTQNCNSRSRVGSSQFFNFIAKTGRRQKYHRGISMFKFLRGILWVDDSAYSFGRWWPPLLGKKGAPANLLRGSRQIFDTENTDRVSLRYRYGKYREIPTDTDRKIPIRDATLVRAALHGYKSTRSSLNLDESRRNEQVAVATKQVARN